MSAIPVCNEATNTVIVCISCLLWLLYELSLHRHTSSVRPGTGREVLALGNNTHHPIPGARGISSGTFNASERNGLLSTPLETRKRLLLPSHITSCHGMVRPGRPDDTWWLTRSIKWTESIANSTRSPFSPRIIDQNMIRFDAEPPVGCCSSSCLLVTELTCCTIHTHIHKRCNKDPVGRCCCHSGACAMIYLLVMTHSNSMFGSAFSRCWVATFTFFYPAYPVGIGTWCGPGVSHTLCSNTKKCTHRSRKPMVGMRRSYCVWT